MPNKKLSGYVHIPFCKKKCSYCDFVSYAGMENQIDEYFEALFREIEISTLYHSTSPHDSIKNRKFSSIYFGGGTPSYVPSRYITQIIDLLSLKVGLEDVCEVTIECNPGTLTRQKAKEYYKAGVNRISIGLQCYSDPILKFIGRIHNCDNFNETVALLKQERLCNLNVDLMIGLPYQRLDDVSRSINQSIHAGANHISLYSLSFESGSEMESLHKVKPQIFPSDDMERRMYNAAKRLLQNHGFTHYEISNFAKPGSECIHNILCWRLHEYLGFGAGAHSYLGGVRFSNQKNILSYSNSIQKIKGHQITKVWDHSDPIELSESEKEFFLLGLRLLQGVDKDSFIDHFHKPMDKYLPVLNRMVQKGLLVKSGSFYCLSSKGIHFANQVFMEFV
jgi:oxygen-independent coproporphyrinogen III oxidase